MIDVSIPSVSVNSENRGLSIEFSASPVDARIQAAQTNVSAGDGELVVEIGPSIIRSGGGGGGEGLPPGGTYGQLLAKASSVDYDAMWVSPATDVEQDNTRPITSAAVYTTVGNINALLATI